MNGISPKFLKDNVEVLALSLCNLVNVPVKQPLFPDQYKIAKLKSLRFRANFSMDSCLRQLTDFILREMNKGVHTGMILVHIQHAFCTLNRITLLQNMDCVGFKESVIKWFQSYLPNRNFFMTLEYVFSDTGLINCVVPQESS